MIARVSSLDIFGGNVVYYKKISEYDQGIPVSHTADQPTAPLGLATEQMKQSNQLSLPSPVDCKTRKDTKKYIKTMNQQQNHHLRTDSSLRWGRGVSSLSHWRA